MCCIVTLLVFFGPRVTLFFLWIFSNILERAYDGFIIPCLGFLILPWTTLAYALAIHWTGGLGGGGLVLLLLGILFDLGTYGGGAWGNRERISGYYR